MEIVIRVNLGVVMGVISSLVLFGVVYDHQVERWERNGWAEGYLSLIVALGVGVTLAGLAVACWPAAVLGLVFFAASGTPMIVGSIKRHVKAREEAMKAMQREAFSADEEGRF